MPVQRHYISVRPQVVVYWCSYGVEVSSNYVTNAIALSVDAESCIITYFFSSHMFILFYGVEHFTLHGAEISTVAHACYS